MATSSNVRLIDDPNDSATLALVAVNGPTVAGVEGSVSVIPVDGTGFGMAWS